jgi:flotillin
MTNLLSVGFLTGGATIIAVVGIVIAIFLFTAIWASRYTSVGPNQVLIISGRQFQYVDADGNVLRCGYRIVKGGGTFVLPVVEKVHVLSLEPVTMEFRFTEVATSTADRVSAAGMAQVKIKGDDISIARAAEHFLSTGPEGIRSSAGQIVESHCRKVISATALEELTKSAAAVSARIEDQAARDLANVNFTIRSFSQSDPILAGTGKPPVSTRT